MRQSTLSVTDSSQAGQARREATRLAHNSDFGERCIGRIALIATELATNLVKHAKSGELLTRVSEYEGGKSFEFLALDRGPGIQNVERCMTDGHSTAGSPGTGLGAIARAADQFDIYSDRKTGTAVVARIAFQKHVPAVGIVHQAKPGEATSGDAWVTQELPCGFLCVLADGLGHGYVAAKAANAIVESVRHMRTMRNASEVMEMAHQAAKPTCGAAVGVAIVDQDAHEVRFAGVGNISAMIIDGAVRHHLVSHNGIVGQGNPKVQEFTQPWSKESVLVLHSDGIGTHWDLSRYPGLSMKDPSLIAGVLYRDFPRTYDDKTVLVVRRPSQ